MSVAIKHRPAMLKHTQIHVYFLPNTPFQCFFTLIAMLCLLYTFCWNILSGDIEINPGLLPSEQFDHYPDTSRLSSLRSTFSPFFVC